MFNSILPQNTKISFSNYCKANAILLTTTAMFFINKAVGSFWGEQQAYSAGTNVSNDVNLNKHGRRAISQIQPNNTTANALASLPLVEGRYTGSFNLAANTTIQDMIIQNNTAYIAAGLGGFQIVDIANIDNPIVTDSYQIKGFAYQLCIKENYVYVAYGIAGLRIIDITNLYNISLAGVYMMGEDNPSITKVIIVENKAFVTNEVNGEFDVIDITKPHQVFKVYLATPGYARGVTVSNDTIYIADDKAGLQIANISSRANPILLGNYELSRGGSAYSVSVSNGIAYVASDTTSLYIVDVNDPRIPQLLGREDSIAGGNAHDVAISDNIVYVADFVPGLKIIDAIVTTNPKLLLAYDTAGPVSSVCVSNGIAYAINYTGGLRVVNVSNPSNPLLLGNSGSLYGSEKIYVSGIFAFIANGNHGLRIYNVNDPKNPYYIGNFNTPGYARDVILKGSIAYISDDTGGLQVIDVSNPAAPKLLLTYPTTGDAWGAVIIDSFAYVASGEAGLQVIDITKEPVPRLDINFKENVRVTDLSQDNHLVLYSTVFSGLTIINSNTFITGWKYNTNGFTRGIAVSDNIVFLENTDGLKIIDSNDPTNLSLIKDYSPGTNAYKIAVSNNLIYIASYPSLRIIDIANPSSPKIMSSYVKPLGSKLGIFHEADRVYLIDSVGSFLVIDVNNPVNPRLLGTFTKSYKGSFKQFAILNKIVYMLIDNANSQSGLSIIDASDPANIKQLGRYELRGIGYRPEAISVTDTMVYMVTRAPWFTSALYIIETSDTFNPQLISRFHIKADLAYDIDISESIAYIANGLSGLQLIDVHDPTRPYSLQRYNLPGDSKAVTVANNLAYIAGNTSGFQIVNLNNQKSYFISQQIASHIIAQNKIAFLVDTGKTLYIIDINDSSKPIEITNYILKHHPQDITISNNHLYLAEGLEGVEIIDVSDNTQPVFAGRINQGISNARSVKVVGNRLYVIDENKQVVVYDIQTLSYLTLINNQFEISEDERHVISSSELNTLAINVNNGAGGVTYTVTNIQQGQFELVSNTGVAITQFTQQQVDAGHVVFVHDGSETAPSFDITASDGVITDGPYTANINYTPVNDVPTILNNQLSVNEGESLILSSNNLSANDIDNNNSSLEFIVNTIANSQFSLVSEPGVIITRFNQGNVTLGQVQFRHVSDFTKNPENLIPSFQLAVSDGLAESNFTLSTINFNAAPRLITNQLNIHKGDSITLNEENLQASDLNNDAGSLVFVVNDVQHGQFELSDQPGIAQTNFTQQQVMDGEVSFSHDNSNSAPSYQVSVQDSLMQAGNATADITFNTQDNDNTGLIAGATVGGVLGLTALLIGAGYFAKNQRDANSRQHHLLADRVRTHLKLTEVDNFKTEKGRKYCRIVEQDIANQLTSHGVHLNTMSDRAIDDLAKQISYAAKNKITGSTSFLGNSKITVDELERKASVIADAVAQQRSNPELYASNRELEKDKNTVELGNFIPKFSFGSNQYETV